MKRIRPSLPTEMSAAGTFPEAISLISSGTIKTAPLVSHVLPIAEFGSGMEIAQNDPGRMKVQFSLDG